jgi:hypothetical protein
VLINTLRFYERILLGLYDPAEEVRDAAGSCLSFLIFHIKAQQIILPPPIVALLEFLPTGRIA